MFGLREKVVEAVTVEPEVTAPYVPPVKEMPPKPVGAVPADVMDVQLSEEYAAVAEEIGFTTPSLLVEQVKLFIHKQDWPIYSLPAVVAYMDGLAEKENPTGYGWTWKPLRAADTGTFINFGRPSTDNWDVMTPMLGVPPVRKITPASDRFVSQEYSRLSQERHPVGAYSKPVPLHALKKVAAIEKEFKGKCVFAVTDYQTQPEKRPDPFLMVMVPNSDIASGYGRFVIDVWDEPGFGIVDMVK